MKTTGLTGGCVFYSKNRDRKPDAIPKSLRSASFAVFSVNITAPMMSPPVITGAMACISVSLSSVIGQGEVRAQIVRPDIYFSVSGEIWEEIRLSFMPDVERICPLSHIAQGVEEAL